MAISCHGLYHFHIIDPLWRDSTGHMWIPLTKDQLYGVLTHFLCFWPKQAGQQPFELPVISDAMTWSHCNEISILIWSLHWTVTLDPLLHATVSFLMKRPSIAQYCHQNSRDTGKTSDLELKKATYLPPHSGTMGCLVSILETISCGAIMGLGFNDLGGPGELPGREQYSVIIFDLGHWTHWSIQEIRKRSKLEWNYR